MPFSPLNSTPFSVLQHFAEVRNFSNASVTIQPAESASWSEARTSLMNEAKAGLKARLEAELGSCANDEEAAELKSKFQMEERALEHKVDHTVHTFSAHIDLSYNVSRRPLLCPLSCMHSRTRAGLPIKTRIDDLSPSRLCAVPFQVDPTFERGSPRFFKEDFREYAQFLITSFFRTY